MAYECPPACGGYTYNEWVALGEMEQMRQIYCALTTGPVTPVAPDYGTTTFDGDTANDGDVVIPATWSTFTVTNLIDSTGSVTVGGVSIPPGVSIGHGSWDGFYGEAITVTSPDATTSAIVTWTLSVPTP